VKKETKTKNKGKGGEAKDVYSVRSEN